MVGEDFPHQLKKFGEERWGFETYEIDHLIGQSKRHLLTRVKEHLSLHKTSGPQSEIKSHIYRCPICHKQFLSIDNFKILKKCKTSYETVIHEALKIKTLRPRLNKQLMKGGVSYLLKVF